MIIESTESLNHSSKIDPIQKQAQEFLQTKSSISSSNLENSQSSINVLKDDAPPDFVNSKLGDLNNLACLAQSLSSYLITVNSKRNGEKLKALTIKIYDSVNIWISRLFRYLIGHLIKSLSNLDIFFILKDFSTLLYCSMTKNLTV